MALNINTLNDKQREAVTTTTGPVLILAGAGSGKTKALTNRIAYLLEQKLVEPHEILAVTFTNKAAGEMKERIGHLLGQNINMRTYIPWMGTFHSICVKILRREGQYVGLQPSFTIYDPSDQLELVKEAMERLKISTKEVNPRAVHSHISSAKNELIGALEYSQFAQGYFQQQVAEVYEIYQDLLKSNQAVDFDDLLMLVANLFQKNEQVLTKYQELFKFILVDEYQDTNHAQYVMINLLAEKHGNICVVGDDDQSIYAFRGATIRNILNFERDYPDAKIIKLEQNYRSTKNILDAAYEVVKKNKQRTDKKLWTDKEPGEKLVLFNANDEKGEADWVVDQIKRVLAQGIPATEIAVLYRTNAQSRSLEEAFVRKAVNYRIVGGVRFYERKEIKDVLAYLRIIFNPEDELSLKRIINVPRRNIGDKAISDVVELANSLQMGVIKLMVAEQDQISNPSVKKFAALVSRWFELLPELNIVELINTVLEDTKYIEMLSDGTLENESRIENIKELISVAAKYESFTGPDGLAAFLEEVSLLEEDTTSKEESSMVTLMTIHAAKGLEFAHVFLVGMEEGLFPHSRVFTDPSELEEERRLAYVAITRAKEVLYMSHTESRLYFGSRQQNLISRFAEDIPKHLIERKKGHNGWEEMDSSYKDEWSSETSNDGWTPPQVKSGDMIEHEFFGKGTILKAEKGIITVKFATVYGTKTLALELAPIRKL